jgi:hypothetical protein
VRLNKSIFFSARGVSVSICISSGAENLQILTEFEEVIEGISSSIHDNMLSIKTFGLRS